MTTAPRSATAHPATISPFLWLLTAPRRRPAPPPRLLLQTGGELRVERRHLFHVGLRLLVADRQGDEAALPLLLLEFRPPGDVHERRLEPLDDGGRGVRRHRDPAIDALHHVDSLL